MKVKIKAKDGNKAISFTKGGEHASLGVPAGEKIPAAKRAAALAGNYGAKARKQELFARNILKH